LFRYPHVLVIGSGDHEYVPLDIYPIPATTCLFVHGNVASKYLYLKTHVNVYAPDIIVFDEYCCSKNDGVFICVAAHAIIVHGNVTNIGDTQVNVCVVVSKYVPEYIHTLDQNKKYILVQLYQNATQLPNDPQVEESSYLSITAVVLLYLVTHKFGTVTDQVLITAHQHK